MKTIEQKDTYNLYQRCQTFFGDGPNHKLKYIQWAAKLHVYKLFSF